MSHTHTHPHPCTNVICTVVYTNDSSVCRFIIRTRNIPSTNSLCNRKNSLDCILLCGICARCWCAKKKYLCVFSPRASFGFLWFVFGGLLRARARSLFDRVKRTRTGTWPIWRIPRCKNRVFFKQTVRNSFFVFFRFENVFYDVLVDQL